MNYNEIDGNLITLALEGKFDIITHGCNCFCTMGAGIAPQIAKAFGADEFDLELIIKYHWDYENDEEVIEQTGNRGDINKLGQIDYKLKYIWLKHPSGQSMAMGHKSDGQEDVLDLYVVNSYTQYHYGANHKDGLSCPIDYEALTLCMRKINNRFKGMHIGLPKIGAGLAGGDWERIKKIIQTELTDLKITVVNYVP